MKKRYINPELVIVKIATDRQMLTVSNPDVLISTDPTETIDAGLVESRDMSFDEEDEDFDFDGEDF